jgi:hypothetical protein
VENPERRPECGKEPAMKTRHPNPIPSGAVHRIPNDLRQALADDADALERWKDLTPLARNEWICWVLNARKTDTRQRRIERVRTEIKEGMRRPCCWPGCPHRKPAAQREIRLTPRREAAKGSPRRNVSATL